MNRGERKKNPESSEIVVKLYPVYDRNVKRFLVLTNQVYGYVFCDHSGAKLPVPVSGRISSMPIAVNRHEANWQRLLLVSVSQTLFRVPTLIDFV